MEQNLENISLTDGFLDIDFNQFNDLDFSFMQDTLVTSDADSGSPNSIVDNQTGSPMGSEPRSPEFQDSGVTSTIFTFENIPESPVNDPSLAYGLEKTNSMDITSHPLVKTEVVRSPSVELDSNSLSQDWLTQNIMVGAAELTADEAIQILSSSDFSQVEEIPTECMVSTTVIDDVLNQDRSNEISDDELIALSVKDLNRRVQGMPQEEVKRLKQRRRTLKNRGYAQNCRTKRNVAKDELEKENSTLENQVLQLRKAFTHERSTNTKLQNEHRKMENYCQNLQRELAKLKRENSMLRNNAQH